MAGRAVPECARAQQVTSSHRRQLSCAAPPARTGHRRQLSCPARALLHPLTSSPSDVTPSAAFFLDPAELQHAGMDFSLYVIFLTGVFLSAAGMLLAQFSCPQNCTCDGLRRSALCDVSAPLRGLPRSTRALTLHGKVDEVHMRGLTELRSLTLRDVNMTSLVFLRDAAATLQRLDAGGCGLTSQLLQSLPRMPALREVVLDHNHLHHLPAHLFSRTPALLSLSLSGNRLRRLGNWTRHLAHLVKLDLSHNQLTSLSWRSMRHLTRLTSLDLSHNKLPYLRAPWFKHTTQLTSLNFAYNPLTHLIRELSPLTHLESLDMSHLTQLTLVDRMSLRSLTSLRRLSLRGARKLTTIHPRAFYNMTSLTEIDLRNCSLRTLHESTFDKVPSLLVLQLDGNPWSCDCALVWLNQMTRENRSSDVHCAQPPGVSLTSLSEQSLNCSAPVITNHSTEVLAKIGGEVRLDCTVTGDPHPTVHWSIPTGRVFPHHPSMINTADLEPHDIIYHLKHYWHKTKEYFYLIDKEFERRIHVLRNGSLFIDYVTVSDGGLYQCMADSRMGNDTVTVRVKLYGYLMEHTVVSMLMGILVSLLFCVGMAVTGLIRHLCVHYSPGQRQRRSQVKRILEQLSEFKSYKLDRLHAYKSAKIDQLSAFKSAKIGQLSAFKSDKVDQLKSLKNVSIGGLLGHMARVRVHYASQMKQIKDNCSSQVREHYQVKLNSIRESGAAQMERLREQYKMQHQHLMKILEILNIESCMSAMDTECMRAESALFDEELDFALDERPIRPVHDVTLTVDHDDDEHDFYMTAASESGSDFSLNHPDLQLSHPDLQLSHPDLQLSHPDLQVPQGPLRLPPPRDRSDVSLCDSQDSPPRQRRKPPRACPPAHLPGLARLRMRARESPDRDSVTSFTDYESAQESRDMSREQSPESETVCDHDATLRHGDETESDRSPLSEQVTQV